MSKAPKKAPSATDKDLPEGNHVLIETDLGSIKIELLPGCGSQHRSELQGSGQQWLL